MEIDEEEITNPPKKQKSTEKVLGKTVARRQLDGTFRERISLVV
jgi:hypothetical protein